MKQSMGKSISNFVEQEVKTMDYGGGRGLELEPYMVRVGSGANS